MPSTTRRARSRRQGGFLMRGLRWLCWLLLGPFRGSATGGASIEHVMVAGVCSLCGLVAFKQYGVALNADAHQQADRITGPGTPSAEEQLSGLGGDRDPGGPELCRLHDECESAPDDRREEAEPDDDEHAKKIAECEKAFAEASEYKFVTARRDLRPDDATARLCESKLEECEGAADVEECERKWQCVYDWVSRKPRTEYFGTATENDPSNLDYAKNQDNVRDRQQNRQNQCASKDPDRTACFKGGSLPAPRGAQIPKAERDALDDAERRRRAAALEPDPKQRIAKMNKASEDAGAAAARAYALTEASLEGYTCIEDDGPGTFDMVCFKGDDVVVIEAKGGRADRSDKDKLGTRRNATGDLRVQQGTEEYVEAIAGVVGSRNRTLKDLSGREWAGREVGLRVTNAHGSRRVRYLAVDQTFDPDTGALIQPFEVREFELDRGDDGECPEGSSGVGGGRASNDSARDDSDD